MTISAFRSIACLIALSILIACSDDSTAPPEPVETNVTLETGNAVSESIGTEGGTLSTTANDGTVYTLEVPEGSIAENQTIRMTPIIDIEGYPVADGVAAGVDLKPDGLVFAVPAILTIETTKTPGAGLVPVAITYEGDASSFATTAARIDRANAGRARARARMRETSRISISRTKNDFTCRRLGAYLTRTSLRVRRSPLTSKRAM